jgi:UDP-3-O-[3-hydroxymyristoyl] glucosamine N-acyltransferase
LFIRKKGSDVLLQDVICGKGVQIGDGVKIESSILGNNVTIGSGAVLGRNCLLGDGVEVAFLVIYCIGMNGAKAKVFAGTTVGSGTFLQRGKTPSKWMAIEEDRGEVSSEEEEDETGERERAKETEPVDVTYQVSDLHSKC